MFSIKNISKRNIYFQGIMLAPYENIIVDKISDFVELSRLFNAGKVSYSRISGNTTKEEPKKVVEEVKPVEPVVETPVETKAEDIKPVEIVEEPVKEEVVDAVEETTAVKDKIEEVEEEKPKTKRSYNKKGKKLDI